MEDLHQDLLELQSITDLGLTDISDSLKKLDESITFGIFAIVFVVCILIGLVVLDILSKRWYA